MGGGVGGHLSRVGPEDHPGSVPWEWRGSGGGREQKCFHRSLQPAAPAPMWDRILNKPAALGHCLLWAGRAASHILPSPSITPPCR